VPVVADRLYPDWDIRSIRRRPFTTRRSSGVWNSSG
jgi:hypothetical protein